ncbi:PQQ-dependent sugar dehydrogenase [Pelagibacteraceae bacterium]|nr:PQQ-dependent sugar dehydrogenase [Pelagibacteraceae bacterium]
MKSKLIRIILFIFLIIITLLFIGVVSISTNNAVTNNIKKIIPLEIKVFLKDNIFFIPTLIDENRKLSVKYSELSDQYDLLASSKDFSNESFFPRTQYIDLDYLEIPVNINNKYPIIKYGTKVNSFYIDTHNDNIFLAYKDGSIYYQNIKSLRRDGFSPNKIETNLYKDMEVTDILVDGDLIYISYAKKNSDGCNEDALRIDVSSVNLQSMEFNKIYHQDPTKFDTPDPLNCQAYNVTGGVMDIISEKNVDYLIVSILDQESKNYFLPKQFENDLTFKYATIIKINIETKDYQTISSGHRNPHGLIGLEDGVILSTEHGPKGGDEINLIKEDKNYGWPFVSYGEPYSYNQIDTFLYEKDHKQMGFEEPIFSFLPSIGISRIMQLSNNFSLKWKKSFLIASLKKESLYRVIFNDKYEKVLSIERMRIGSRIRDMGYSEDLKAILLALESNSGAIGIITNKK